MILVYYVAEFVAIDFSLAECDGVSHWHNGVLVCVIMLFGDRCRELSRLDE